MKQQNHNSALMRLTWRIVLANIGGIIALAPNVTIAAPPTPTQVAQARAYLHTYYAWINAPWSEDDQPYQRIREAIDQAVTSEKKPADILKQYQAIFSKSPSDYQAQFGYYYAAYKYASAPNIYDNHIGLEVLGNLSTTIIRKPHPHTYNYARLVFLCDQYNYVDPNLKAVGIRLVRRDPSDYDVKFYTVSTLAASSVPSDRVLAITYAQDLIQRYPKKASSYSLLASVHYQSWLRKKDPHEASEAIAGYQQYLRLAPPESPFRKQIQGYITQLKKS